MSHKPTTLMIYSRNAIKNFVPNVNAVYYLRGIADENSLYPIYYIGRSQKRNLREELLKKFFESKWTDVIYVNYIECDNAKEARNLQENEVKRHQPKYNFSGKNMPTISPKPTFQYIN